MIFKSASPISPNVSISIDKVPTDYMQIQRIVIEEEENKHTMAVLDFAGIAPDTLLDYVDKPIRVSIDFDGLSGTDFVGYITFLEPTSVTHQGLVNSSPFQLTRMYCMSASYIMKSKKSRAWENVTLSDIALRIADSYKLSVAVPMNSYRFTRLTQSNQSDWAFLVETSKKLGYSVSITGTHLHIWDPFTLLNRNISYSVLQNISGANRDVTPSSGQILKFEGRLGAVTSSATRSPDTLHVLSKDGVLSSLSSSLTEEVSGFGDVLQSRFSDTVSINADSYEMGKRLISGELRHKFSNTATVVITGSPEIRPGGIVKIEKYNSKLDGFWYVTSAKHEINRSELVSTLTLATDSTAVETPTYNKTTPYMEPPKPSLIGGTWVSSTHSAIVYN